MELEIYKAFYKMLKNQPHLTDDFIQSVLMRVKLILHEIDILHGKIGEHIKMIISQLDSKVVEVIFNI